MKSPGAWRTTNILMLSGFRERVDLFHSSADSRSLRFCFQLGQKYHFVLVRRFRRFSMCAIPHWGETSQHVSGACQFGSQRLRAGNAILTPRWVRSISNFAPVSSKGVFFMHTHGHRFKCVLWAFTAFCFLGEQRTQFFARLAPWQLSDGRASANSRRTENGTPKFRKGYGRASKRAVERVRMGD